MVQAIHIAVAGHGQDPGSSAPGYDRHTICKEKFGPEVVAVYSIAAILLPFRVGQHLGGQISFGPPRHRVETLLYKMLGGKGIAGLVNDSN